MALIREFDPIFRPLSFSDRVYKALELTHKLHSQTKRHPAHLSTKHKILITSVAIAAFFFLTLVIPAATTAGSAAFGFWKLNQAQHQADSFDFASAKTSAESSASAFNLASSEFTELQLPLVILGRGGFFKHLNNFISTEAHLSSSLSKFSDAADSVSSLGDSLISRNTITPLDNSETTSTLEHSSSALRSSISDLNTANSHEPFSHNTLTSMFVPTSSYIDTVSSLQESQRFLSQLISIWPTVTSLQGEKRYLILIADSHSLHPGGGSVVGVGLLDFQQGKLRSTTFDDVPFTNSSSPVLQDFLGKSGVNFETISASPDYSASSSALIKSFAGGNIAGVITIDDRTLSSLLNILGPVTPSGYKDEINSDSITQVSHALLNSSPSAKGILTATASEIISKFFLSPTKFIKPLYGPLISSLASKDLLISFTNPSLSSLALEKDWSGSISSEKVLGSSTSSIADFLMTDLLTSGDESDKWQSNLQVDYTPSVNLIGQVQSHLELTITNTSSSSTDSTHQESFKVYAPAGASLVTSSSASSTSQESGLTTFTIPFSINPGGSATVSLIYTLPRSQGFPTSYLLHIQKQPASSPSSLQFHLASPSPIKILGSQGAYQVDKNLDFKLTIVR